MKMRCLLAQPITLRTSGLNGVCCVFYYSNRPIRNFLIVEPSLSTPEEKLFLRCSLIVAKNTLATPVFHGGAAFPIR